MTASPTVTQVAESIPAGSVAVFNPASTSYVTAAFDPNTAGKFVVTYRDNGNSSYGKAVVGTVSGTSITFGTPVVFKSSAANYVYMAFDPTTAGRFVVTFDTANVGRAMVGTVSGNSISFGTEVTFNSSAIRYSSVAFDPNTSGKFVIAYTDFSNSNYGKVIVGTISGTAITMGTGVIFNAGLTQYNSVSFDPNTAGKFAIAYRDYTTSQYGKAIVGTTSGTSITMGTGVIFNTGSGYYNSIAFDPNTTGKFVVAYKDGDNGSKGTAVIGTVSGTSITYGSEYLFNSGGGTTYISAAFDPNTAGKFVVAYSDGPNSDSGTVIVGTVSGTAITFGSEIVFNSGLTLPYLSFDSSVTGKFVIVYQDYPNSNYGRAVVGQLATTVTTVNLTSTNFLGTSTAAYTNAQTASIMLQGSVSTNQTGLTIGSTYYVQPDGTLATTAGSPSVEAGKALSATSLLLSDPAGGITYTAGTNVSISAGNVISATDTVYADTDVASYLFGNLDTHILPDTNATYDIGSASYKIRDLYLSDNSLHIGDGTLSRSSGGTIQWNNEDIGGGGAWEVISSQTVTSDVTSVDFESFGTHTKLALMYEGAYGSSGDNWVLQLKMNGSYKTSGYSTRIQTYDTANTNTAANTGVTKGVRLGYMQTSSMYPSSGLIDIPQIESGVMKLVRAQGINWSYGYDVRFWNSGGWSQVGSGLDRDGVLQGIRIKPEVVNISGGTFTLYGIKNS